MAGLLSKGIKFSVGTAVINSAGECSITSAQEIPNLQSIPALGGEPEKVDVTVLANAERHYINGIKDYGDLEFGFLYDNSTASSNYRLLKGFEGQSGKGVLVELPDGTSFAFAADLSVALDEAEVNTALTFTCACALQSDITVSNPS